MDSKKKNRAAGTVAKQRQTHRDLQIEALTKRVNKLESAHDQNTQVFSDALKVMEIKHNVLEQLLSMLHRDGAGLVAKEDGSIDFGYYLKAYLEKLGAKEEQAPPPPAIVSPDDESPIIFGG